MRRGDDGVWRVDRRPRLAQRGLRATRCTSTCPTLDEVVTNMVTDPYSRRAHHRLRALACSSTWTTRRSRRAAGRGLAQAELRPARGRDDPGAARPRLLDRRRDRPGRAPRHLPRLHRRAQRRACATCATLAEAGHHLRPPAARLRHRHHRGEPRRRSRSRRCDLRLVPARLAGAAGVRRRRSPPRTASTGATTRCTTRRPRAPTPPTPTGTARTLRVPRDGRRASTAPGCASSWTSSTTTRPAAGQDPKSVLDRIVPGYYQRLPGDGAVADLHLLRQHRDRARHDGQAGGRLGRHLGQGVQGRRLPLRPHGPPPQGQHPRRPHGPRRADPRRDGVDGKEIFLYGEGWNFGEVADDARFVQATPAQHGRHRHRAPSPTGRATPCAAAAPSTRTRASRASPPASTPTPTARRPTAPPAEQRARLLHYQDLIKVGLTGNLRDYRFTDATGRDRQGLGGRLQRPPAGYAAAPARPSPTSTRTTTRRCSTRSPYKLPRGTSMADRARMTGRAGHRRALPGPRVLPRRHRPAALQVAGPQLLRLRRLVQRDRLVAPGSTFGSGPAAGRRQRGQVGLHAPAAGRPGAQAAAGRHRGGARAAPHDLLRIRFSSPLFRLGSARADPGARELPAGGPGQTPGVIVMAIAGRRIASSRASSSSSTPRPDRPPDRAVARRPPLRAASRAGGRRGPGRPRGVLRRASGTFRFRRAPWRCSWRASPYPPRLPMKLIYTYTDEAPALATHSFLPIIEAFAGAGRRRHRAARHLARRAHPGAVPGPLTDEQRVPDALAELGELAKTPEANIIKLPNISASIPQLKAAIKELQDAGYDVPDYPDDPRDRRREGRARGLRPREGQRGQPGAARGQLRPPRARVGEVATRASTRTRWARGRRTPRSHVATMADGDFRSHRALGDDGRTTTSCGSSTSPRDGAATVLKGVDPGAGGRDRRRRGDARARARRLPRRSRSPTPRSRACCSPLHLKATMMKVSDPIIFGHAVRAFFAGVFTEHDDALAQLGASPNNGLGSDPDRARGAARGRARRDRGRDRRRPTRPAPDARDGRLRPRDHEPARAERRDHRRVDAGDDPHVGPDVERRRRRSRTRRPSSPTRATRRCTRRRSTSAASTARSTRRRWARRRTSA